MKIRNFCIDIVLITELIQILCCRNVALYNIQNVSYMHWKKKYSDFDLKNWVIGGTKIRPRVWKYNKIGRIELFVLYVWRIFESNWLYVDSQFQNRLSISSQFDSNIWLTNIVANVVKYRLNRLSVIDSN